MKAMRLPGIIAYATIALWFLLTVMTPLSARAETAGEETPTTTSIRVSDILPSIEAALMEKGVAPDAEIILEAPDTPIVIASGAAPQFDSVSVNPRSGRFLIRARGVAGTQSVAIAGRAAVTTRYPVLTRSIERGEIISEADLTYNERNDIQAALFVTNASELIGKEARRPLRADAPLRRSDIKSPQLVKKGALVTMTYEGDGLRLSHHGVASGAGAMGDVINIENVKSERTIKAVVTGTNRARVIGARQTVAAKSEF